MPWLYKWIRNSSALIKSGDAAVKVYEENNSMTAFPALSDADIDDIIAYTQSQKRSLLPWLVLLLVVLKEAAFLII
jgi:mono/diheme cytochrome c family protein